MRMLAIIYHKLYVEMRRENEICPADSLSLGHSVRVSKPLKLSRGPPGLDQGNYIVRFRRYDEVSAELTARPVPEQATTTNHVGLRIPEDFPLVKVVLDPSLITMGNKKS